MSKLKSKKNDSVKKNKIRQIKIVHNTIEEFNIFDYNKELMLIHGANINLARAISNIYDGLKPVERRIMYTMFELEGLKPNGKTKKVSQIVGSNMGSFYPHAETASVEVIVRLAQWWSVYPLLVLPQGNFGSIYGDCAAAMRLIL